MMLRETRVEGHFGEFLQGRVGPGGPVALISIPCPALTLSARLEQGPGFEIAPPGQKVLKQERARKFLACLGETIPGRVTLNPGMPVGGGAGASTAALVALARLAGWQGTPETLARACVQSEGATDPLMFDAPERLLWASREGRVLRKLGSIPPLHFIGGFFGPPSLTDAGDAAFPDIADLLDPWDAAARSGDAVALARLAATSARRTLALRGPTDDPTESLADRLSASGFAIAHTGSARALLFVPGHAPDNAKDVLRRSGFRQIVRFRVG